MLNSLFYEQMDNIEDIQKYDKSMVLYCNNQNNSTYSNIKHSFFNSFFIISPIIRQFIAFTSQIFRFNQISQMFIHALTMNIQQI